jgi:predicted transcriptional regulator
MSQTILTNNNLGTQPVTITRPERISKKEQAKQLYLKYHNLPREQIIQKFIEEIDIPESSARTYASICAKDLNETIGKEFKTRNVNRTNSKREKAFQIYTTYAHLSRKEIIEKMKNELNMTHNSAATHCSLAAKEYRQGRDE